MDKNAKIYVAGHRGLVGSALMRNLTDKGYTNLLTRIHAELDLTNQAAVRDFFASERPEYAFLAAAKVGGLPRTRPTLQSSSTPTCQSRTTSSIQLGSLAWSGCYF